MAFLKVSGITQKGEGNFLLQHIHFEQKRFQKIAVTGETGSGKSTLLKIIAGLIQPDEGKIIFEDELVVGPDDKLVPGHPAIAYLSQGFDLPKFLRVEQVLEYSNTLSGVSADKFFKVCQIDHLLKRKTDQLSGGEKQRIAIARLLISQPRLLLLDEPFSHLDMPHKTTLKAVISDIGKKLKISCILVSHEPSDTLSWADQIIVMKEGKLIQFGTPEDIYWKPVNQYVAGLFGKYSLIKHGSHSHKILFRNLSSSFDKENKNKNLIVRPQSLKIGRKGTKSVRGQVVDTGFAGSHYEVYIETGHNIFTVNTTSSKVNTGDIVYVSLAGKSIWYI